LYNLASLLKAQGKLSEAEPLSRRALEAQERTLGPEHPSTLVSVNNLAWLEFELAHTALAIPLFERCAVAYRDASGFERLWPHLGLALCTLLDTGDAAPAEWVIAELITLLGPDHERVEKARARLAKVREALGGQQRPDSSPSR
jgi:hypothetical protein